MRPTDRSIDRSPEREETFRFTFLARARDRFPRATPRVFVHTPRSVRVVASGTRHPDIEPPGRRISVLIIPTNKMRYYAHFIQSREEIIKKPSSEECSRKEKPTNEVPYLLACSLVSCPHASLKFI